MRALFNRFLPVVLALALMLAGWGGFERAEAAGFRAAHAGHCANLNGGPDRGHPANDHGAHCPLCQLAADALATAPAPAAPIVLSRPREITRGLPALTDSPPTQAIAQAHRARAPPFFA